MYAEINSALASLKVLTDIAKTANSMSNRIEMLDAVTTLQQQLHQALSASLATVEKQAALAERVRELESELAAASQWDRKSKDYQLRAVGAHRNHFVQAFVPSETSRAVRHWACANCFETRRISVLSALGRSYKCGVCQLELDPIIQGGSLAPIESAYDEAT